MSNSASSFTGVSSGYTAGTPVPADSPIRDNIADAVRRVRETTPLAQSFTNFVTINLVANAQLAAGGTAAMSLPAGRRDRNRENRGRELHQRGHAAAVL